MIGEQPSIPVLSETNAKLTEIVLHTKQPTKWRLLDIETGKVFKFEPEGLLYKKMVLTNDIVFFRKG